MKQQPLSVLFAKNRTAFIFKTLIFAFAAITVLSLFNLNAYGQRAGIVLEQRGSWQAAGRNLSPNSTINAGEVIRNISGSRNDYIYIIDRQSGLATRRNCRVDNCSQSFVLPQNRAPAPRNSYFSRAWNTVYTWFFSDPRYREALTRGEKWQETLLKIDEGKVNLMPFLETFNNGVYVLGFTPVPTKPVESKKKSKSGFGREKKAPEDSRQYVEIKIRWDKKNKGDNKVEGLSAGIYELSNVDEPQTVTWVLIMPPNKYEKAANEFAEIKKITGQWEKEEIGAQTIKAFWRAHIDYLAQKYSVSEKK